MSDKPSGAEEQSLIVNQLIAEFMSRTDAGESLDAAQFIAEHPEHTAELKRHFANVDELEGLVQTDSSEIAATMLNPADAGEISTEDATAHTIVRGTADSETSVTRDHTQKISSSATCIEIPETFGRYAIQKVLGQGAMGAVYLAKDTQLDRDVALKIPKFDDSNGVDDEELLERFYREARASATLRSPNICPVYDVGEIDGQHYITMAYIEGRPLKDFTKSKKSHSEKQIITTIRKLATGLAEAHSIGVIHRDLKPANIMVDQKGEPVVMDFGLARRSASDDVQVTQSGAILGTPAYMAPEQVAGDQVAINHQVDIYALGIIMYELITGEMPFKGNLMAILQQIALNNPTKPSELRKKIDPRLETICLKMMAGEQSKRYQSMTDVAADLQDVLRNPGKRQKKEEAKKSGPKPTSIPSAHEESNPALISVQQPKSYAEQLRKKKSKAAKKSKSPKSSTKLPQTSPSAANGKNKKFLIAGGLGGLILLLGIVFIVRLGKYDVKITLDDPSIQLSVDGIPLDKLKITDGDDVYRLSAGEHKLKLQKENFTTHVEEFTVTKDGNTVLRAVVVNDKLDGLLNGEKPAADTQNKQNKLAAIDKGLKRGLVGHWNFEEGQGTKVWDSSGQGNHGTLLEMEPDAWSDESPPSIFSGKRSIQFQNKTRVEVPDSPSLNIKDEITITFWSKLSGKGGKALTNGYNLGFAFTGSPTHWRWQIAEPQTPSGDRPVHVHTVGFDDMSGKWAHFTARYDGRETSWFLNGRLMESAPYRGQLQDSNKPLTLGNDDSGTAPVGGLLDDIRIYNRALTEAEIRRLANLSDSDIGFEIWNADSETSPGSDGIQVGRVTARENALVFDGVDDYVEIKFDDKTIKRLQNPPFTVEAWIRSEAKTATRQMIFQSPGDPWINIFRQGNLHPETVDCWAAGRGGSSGLWDQSFASRITPEKEWVHIAAVWDGKRPNLHAKIFVNGKESKLLSESGKYQKKVSPPRVATIGATFNQLKDHFKGAIRDLRISTLARYPEDFEPEQKLISDSNTLALYDFDEGTGDVLKDSSGNGHDGKIIGAKWVRTGELRTASIQKNTAQHALEFDGNSKVSIPVTNWGERDELTYEVFVQVPVGNNQESKIPYLINQTFTAALICRPDHWQFIVNEKGDKGVRKSISHQPPTQGQWVHLAGVIKQNTVQLFVDGEPMEPAQLSGRVNSESGNQVFLGTNFKGTIRGVRISKTALFRDRFEPPQRFAVNADTLAIYKFDEGTGDILKDSSGNGHDGKIIGAKWVGVSGMQATPPSPATAPFDDAQGKIHQQVWAAYLGEPVVTTNSIGMQLAVIPPGKFKIGREEIEADVTLTKHFRIGIHEVTQGQWTKVMETEPWEWKRDKNSAATFVSWIDAKNFCRQLTEGERRVGKISDDEEYRLPTEAEWEWACRAGTITKFSFGDDESELGNYAWYKENTGESFKFGVGLKKPNAWGLYDVHGNVSEWCGDWHGKRFIGGRDPRVLTAGPNRAIRGGTWFDPAKHCRSTARFPRDPSYQKDGVGFRIILSPISARSDSSSLDFQTPGDRVTVPELPVDLQKPFTIEAWLTADSKPNSASPNRYLASIGPVILKLYQHKDGEFIQAGVSGFNTKINTWAGVAEGSPVPQQSGAPMHVAYVFDGEDFHLFVNGSSNQSHSELVGAPLLSDVQLKQYALDLLKRNQNRMFEIGTSGSLPQNEDDNLRGQVHEVRISQAAKYAAPFQPQMRLPAEQDTIALYHFDEGSGDVLHDSSGNGYDGKIIGAKWVRSGNFALPMQETRAAEETVLRFEPGDGVDIDSLIDETESLTMELWVEVDEILSHIYLIGPHSRYFLGIENREFSFKDRIDPKRREILLLDPDQWTIPKKLTHLAFVRDAQQDELRLYVDGQLFDKSNDAGQPTNGKFQICGKERQYAAQKGKGFQGILDEIRISNSVRYSGDSFTPKRQFAPDPETLALYHFDEGSGDVLKDSSGNGHDGNIIGAKWVKADVTKSPSNANPLPSKQRSEVDRKATEWVLSVGGVVTTEEGEIKSQNELPGKPFRVIGIDLADKRFDMNDLANLRGLTHIQTLNLYKTQTNAQGLAHVQDLKSLRELNLQFCNPSDDGLEQLKGLTNLRILNLTAPHITNDALIHLKELKQLADLNLGFAKDVDDSGLIHLRGLTNLQAIGLGDTSVRDLPHLNELQGLRYVALKSTNVSAKGVQQLKDLPELTQLLITAAPLTDSDLMQFSGSKNLRVLYMQDTKVTAAGIAAFKQANPGVKFNSGFEKQKLLPQTVTGH